MFHRYGREFLKKKSMKKIPPRVLESEHGKTEGKEGLGVDQGPETLATFVRNSESSISSYLRDDTSVPDCGGLSVFLVVQVIFTYLTLNFVTKIPFCKCYRFY